MNKSLLLLLLLLRIFKGNNESKEGKATQMEIFILFAGRYEELLIESVLLRTLVAALVWSILKTSL